MPGWRWRRELCVTERSKQCQSGPTTCETPFRALAGSSAETGEKRLPARQRWTHARHRSGARAGSTAEAAWKWEARAGGTAGTRSTREWTALFQKTRGQHRLEARRPPRRSGSGWHRQTAMSERVRVAPPGTPASPQRRRVSRYRA